MDLTFFIDMILTTMDLYLKRMSKLCSTTFPSTGKIQNPPPMITTNRNRKTNPFPAEDALQQTLGDLSEMDMWRQGRL